MKKFQAFRLAVVAAAIAGPLTAAMATNGYFSHGYGMKAKGMGGAAVAMTDNAFAGANNPAAAAWAGNRMELGVDIFMPDRGMKRTGGAVADVRSDSKEFYVPEFGYNRALSDKLGVGITIYGNGGLNTDYAGGQTDCSGVGGQAGSNPLCGTGRLGISVQQLIVAPTVGYKVAPNHSLGVSPLLVNQTMKAEGLQGFGQISADDTKLTNKGNDTSNGIGVRFGYLGKISDQLSIGASYAPKIAMSKFEQYKGLFAEGGGFDIPENYTIGFSLKATPTITVAGDYERISYGDIKSVGNPQTNMPNQKALGLAGGPGFGWSSINVYKLGVNWQATPKLLMRAGFNYGDNPIQSRDVTFNILATGVTTTHYTLGGTYALSEKSEVTFAYMYAPENSTSGTSFYQAPRAERIYMSQQSLGVQFGWKF